MGNTITALEALKFLSDSSALHRALDVRSEGEFGKASLPFTCNIPILNDEHRHLVGTTYKTRGNEEATRLGHSLVGPLKNDLLDQWKKALAQQQEPLLFCWRGGDRSGIAQRWLGDAGINTLRVEGGYKALRNQLLLGLENLPQFRILSGPTGSLKTDLLLEIPVSRRIDLEGHAQHRGSAFGLEVGTTQPSQALFENRILLDVFSKSGPILLEDESRLIGFRSIPLELWTAMVSSPRVVLEVPLDVRAENIVTGYIESPVLEKPEQRKPLEDYFLDALTRIRRRLGGCLYDELSTLLKDAFASPDFDREAHHKWVRILLDQYYDKAYEHSFRRSPKEIIFRGSTNDCRQWLESKFEAQ